MPAHVPATCVRAVLVCTDRYRRGAGGSGGHRLAPRPSGGRLAQLTVCAGQGHRNSAKCGPPNARTPLELGQVRRYACVNDVDVDTCTGR
jgi:hypothetical protein